MPTALDFPSPASLGQKHPQPPVPNQPVYTFDGVKWTTHGEAVDDVIGASNLTPLPDGVATAGVEANWSRGDHVHPALINDLVLTGNPTAPTPPLGDNDTSIATTAFVQSTVVATEIGTSVLTGSTAPVGAADNSLWFEDDTGRLYIFYNDGTGPSQWVAAAPVPDAITSRYGIYAAPFDAMAYSGMQINGGMEVSQEKGTSGTSSSNTYVCDGWRLYWSGSMVIGGNQGTASIAPGFPYQLYQQVGTAQPSLGAGDVAFLFQPIEGWRIARLGWGTANAQPITIAFWSSHVRIGIYSVAVRNSASNRSYVATYNQAVSNVAQYNVVTIPGDTTGVWPTDNTTGMVLSFALGIGTTLTAPAANTWYGVNYLAAPGQVNGVAATSDVARYTGVTVLPGTQYPSAAQSALVMRPYDQELATCQRYFEFVWGSYRQTMNAGGTAGTMLTYKAVKRAVPTLTYGFNGGTSANTTFQTFYTDSNMHGTGIQFIGTANADSYNYMFRVTVDARL